MENLILNKEFTILLVVVVLLIIIFSVTIYFLHGHKDE